MEHLTALGTGYAIATNCYTTSFTISDGKEHFMIDCGGGSGVLTQLDHAGIPLSAIHHIFLSHRHTDHIMGAVWMIRMIGHGIEKGVYEDKLHIYCHKELADGLLAMCQFMLPGRMLPLFGTRILFHCLADGLTFDILGRKTVFFDTHSKKTMQYGVQVTLQNGKTITYLGDEPYREVCAPYAEAADYLMHEALCVERDEAIYHPHKIQHSTVKDAAECAESIGAKNLILFHTEDKHLAVRKHTYTKEAEQYFSGTTYVPDDLDTIIL